MIPDDDPIPAFLRRTPNKTPPAPADLPTLPPAPYVDPVARRQAELRAAHEATRRAKSRGRVAKMLAKKDDQAAAAAGKTWDPIRGGWR